MTLGDEEAAGAVHREAHHIAAVLAPGAARRHAYAGLCGVQALGGHAQVAVRRPLHLLVGISGACRCEYLQLSSVPP